MKLFEIYKEFKNSPNKIYIIEKHKSEILTKFLILAFLLSFLGYFFIEDKHLLESITSSLRMLTFSPPDDYKPHNIFFPIVVILIGFVIFYSVATTFFKDSINSKITKNIRKQEHLVVFGLKDINRAFLNDEENSKKNIIIVEKDLNNIFLDDYRNRGFGVVVEDVVNNNFNVEDYKNMKYAIICLENDRLNIDFAIDLINILKNVNNHITKRLIIHIENDDLKDIFNQKLLNYDDLKQAKIDIKTFSFFQECSNELFEKHSFISNKDIKNSNEIKSLILGNGNLALKIIEDLLLLSNLPNKNIHTIYLIDEKADELFNKIELTTYFAKDKFPSINIEILNISYKNIKYFKQNIFEDSNISNIYICYDDESINLNLAIELNDKIFTKKSVKANLYLAIFENYSFIKNSKFIDIFTVFGNKNEIFSKNRLIDEKNYTISKLINSEFNDEFKKDKLVLNESNINKKWFNTEKYFDRLSSIAQAKHLNIKLQALGLKKVESKKNKKIVLQNNLKIFEEIINPLLKESNTNYKDIYLASLELKRFYSNKDYEVKYIPKNYSTLFEKLILCEHSRLNSFYFLNGWEYNKIENESKKELNSLKCIQEFKEKELQIKILEYVYSILYIPNYLASAGYEIERLE